MEEIPNAEPIDYDSDPDGNGFYPFDTAADFYCEKGYKLIGPEYNSCYGNSSSPEGVFGPFQPTCECELIILLNNLSF